MPEAREESAVTESEAPGPRRLHLAALVLVLIVGGLLRLHHLAAPSLTVDEISTVAIVTGHVFRDIPQRGSFEAGQLAGRCSGPPRQSREWGQQREWVPTPRSRSAPRPPPAPARRRRCPLV